MQRNTYIKIDLDRLRNNIKEIVKNYKYKYYIGVVKNNCYHHGLKSIKEWKKLVLIILLSLH